ncbi:RAB11-binding protein RELCH homolog [Nematolebias whitei]|uniref:RAB11-binding protein RELCH homolog n=1 Tax=Nematolebias whitei TaxID=451745 RepID=UPI001897256B|nr:RAB11-binding protein RELCH homolog [Nematolebias whitei]
MASVNPFNLSDSEEEAERRPSETVDTERSPSDGAPGPPPSNPFSPTADAEPPTLLLSSNRTSPSGEGILSASAAATSAMAGGAETRISVDVIAAQLLRDQYILTALEFHTELLEAGRELPRLRDYFSNPGNFERQSGTPPAREQALGPGGPLNRAGSISTLDSLDFARYSDDGNRETDERVAVLEFELRKAKETIQALRANLTQAAESEVPSQERKNFKSSPEIQESIRPLEKRALNFLVNEYLLKNEYKLSSITFSDENDDQDFELWDDVGLNIPKPPDLLQLYRNCGSTLTSPRDKVDASVEVDFDDLPGNCDVQEHLKKPDLSQQQQTEVVQELEYQLNLLNSEKQSLAEQIKQLQSEIQTLKKSVSAPPPANLDLGLQNSSHPSSSSSTTNSCSTNPPPVPPADNGQYLDIRGVSEAENNLASASAQNTSQHRQQSCSKVTSQSRVQFDQPNR